MYFRFTEQFEYELTLRKKRMDILLKKTLYNKEIKPFSSDDRIVKMLIRQQPDGTLISFFFRYPPQNIKENVRKEPATLMLDILLGNQFTSMYPDISSQFKGVTLIDRDTIDYTNPINVSPYPGDWLSFFSEYESPVDIRPPATYTLPPFPLAAALEPRMPVGEWLPDHITNNAAKNNWELVSQQIREQLSIEKDVEIRNFLLLSYADALVRMDDYYTSHRLLQEIIYNYPETEIAHLAEFLFVYLRSKHESDFPGFYQLKEAIDKVRPTPLLNSYFTLLQAEAALELGKIDKAGQLLNRDDIGYDELASAIRLMRRADLLYLSKEKIKALVLYLQAIDKNETIIAQYPDSLARFCDVLYTFKRYEQAARQYTILNEHLHGRAEHELALFRLEMSKLHQGENEQLIKKALFDIQDSFPGTEGADRATLKQLDIDFINGRFKQDTAVAAYNELSEKANIPILREEAMFKQALVYLLQDDPENAVRQCMKMLREFQAGAMRTEARALIIQQLPELIHQLVAQKKYIEALVLAQQNRTLFTRGWVTSSLLYDLAKAYTDLGFFDRAARTYQYLFHTSTGDEQEKIYLPLIQSLYDAHQYTTIEDYADRFTFRFPDSKLYKDIFLLRIKALLENNETLKALQLMDNTDRPTSRELEQLAINMYYQAQRWNDVITKLEGNVSAEPSPETEDNQMRLAESYFQTKQFEKAVPYLQAVAATNKYGDQAMFRLARIDQIRQNSKQALNRLQQLAEKGREPLWQELAREELSIIKLKEKM